MEFAGFALGDSGEALDVSEAVLVEVGVNWSGRRAFGSGDGREWGSGSGGRADGELDLDLAIKGKIEEQ